MLVVVASRFDAEAAALVDAWGTTAALLTPDDLARPGWVHRPRRPRQSRAVIRGEAVPYPRIRGVLPLLPAVAPHDLDQIVEEDRDYVAAEMTAFLRVFLATLSCRVINRPTGHLLSGSDWTPERWRWEAVALGMPLASGHSRRPTLVTTVAGQAFGSTERGPESVELAKAAGLDVLTAAFVDDAFLAAMPRPDMGSQPVVRALKDFLEGEQ